jgi:hypothetical protein
MHAELLQMAALPYVGLLLPAHNLESLERLLPLLAA